MLRHVMESFGATAALAAEGHQALRVLPWIRPDLIFCDLQMPVIDGFGVIDRLRQPGPGDPQ